MAPPRRKSLSRATEFILEQLAPLEDTVVRQMYGCTTLMREGRMYALINADGELFVKVDAENRSQFDQFDSRAFTYEMKDRSGAPKSVAMSYFSPPESALEDRDELRFWVHLGIEAVTRAPAKKPRKRTSAVSDIDDLDIG